MLVVIFACAIASAEARPKKTSVRDVTIIKPSANKYKKFDAKKLDKKKARFKKESGENLVIEKKELKDSKLVSPDSELKKSQVISPNENQRDSSLVVPSQDRISGSDESQETTVKNSKKVETKIDHLYESAPDQVEVEKKKRNRWKFWKK